MKLVWEVALMIQKKKKNERSLQLNSIQLSQSQHIVINSRIFNCCKMLSSHFPIVFNFRIQNKRMEFTQRRSPTTLQKNLWRLKSCRTKVIQIFFISSLPFIFLFFDCHAFIFYSFVTFSLFWTARCGFNGP